MGIFRGNTTSLGKYSEDCVPCFEGYEMEGSYLRIIGETFYNESVIFEEELQNDMNEYAAIKAKEELESKGMFTEASNIQIISESADSTCERIKNMLLKAWGKVKALYNAIIIKVQSLFAKDYKKFYEKNKTKFDSYADKIEGKFKFRKPKDIIKNRALVFTNVEKLCDTRLRSIMLGSLDDETYKKRKEELNNGDFLDTKLSSILGISTSRKEFNKDFDELCFEEKDTFEKLTPDIIKEIKSVMGSDKIIKNLKDAQEKNNTFFKNRIKEVDTIKKNWKHDENQTSSLKDSNNNPYKTPNTDYNFNRVILYSKELSVYQTINNMINGAYIKNMKHHIAQCKSVFTQVLSRSGFEEQTLISAIAESVYYDTLDSLN